MTEPHSVTHDIFAEVWQAMGGDPRWQERLRVTGEGALPSPFHATDLAAAVIGAAGCAVGELLEAAGHDAPEVAVDRVLASGWFYLPDTSKLLKAVKPHSVDWTWVTEFPTADGRFLRAQAIFPTLRRRLVEALGTKEDPAEVAAVIAAQDGDTVEAALVEAGAAVAVNRTVAEWLEHPAARAVQSEPIVGLSEGNCVVGRIFDRAELV